MAIIVSVLQSWGQSIGRVILDALSFYYRLITNKMGLPRWLWVLILVAWVGFFGTIFYLDFGKH